MILAAPILNRQNRSRGELWRRGVSYGALGIRVRLGIVSPNYQTNFGPQSSKTTNFNCRRPSLCNLASPFTAVKMSNAELATSYAALILADDGVDITVRPCTPCARVKTDCSQADKLNTLIKAAGVPDVEPIWATLFAKVLE